MPANALSSATWSAMLALGASIGGLVTALAGRNVAFVINALSFFASSYFIAQTRYDSTPPPAPPLSGWFALTGIPDLLEGLRYVRAAGARRGADVRQGGLGAGGRRPCCSCRSSASGCSRSAAARRPASACSTVLAASAPRSGRSRCGGFSASSRQALRRTIGPAYFIVGAFYIALAFAPTLPLAALCVLLAHFGGAILWVFSTVLLQLEVPDRFRGRVFAAELALVTLTSSARAISRRMRSTRPAGVRDECRSCSARCSACPA